MQLTIQEQTDLFYKRTESILDKRILALALEFDLATQHGNAQKIRSLIEKAREMLKKDLSDEEIMQLNYHIATAFSTLKTLDNNNETEHLEKEIYTYRFLLDLYEKKYPLLEDDGKITDAQFVADYIAMRSYNNLGNSMQFVGRYVESISNFYNALSIAKNFAMASLNLSYALFTYGSLQIKPHEVKCYFNAGHHYYSQAVDNKYNLENESYLDRIPITQFGRFDQESITECLVKPFELNLLEEEEIAYRSYIAGTRLFLEPCADIIVGSPCFFDSLTLPLVAGESAEQDEFICLFNLMKQEYAVSRYIWYCTTVEDAPLFPLAEREIDLVSTGELYVLNANEMFLRNSFKTTYSIFDRIGFFINHYFKVGLKGRDISFKNIWNKAPNPIDVNLNPMLKAIYWLQKDFFEEDKINLTSPNAIRMSKMRNDMEHNYLLSIERRTSRKASITNYTTSYEIGCNTERLLKLARECLIYLSLAVGFEKKKG